MRSQRVGHDWATSLPLYLCQKLGVTSQFMCAICAFLVLCFHLSFIKITEQLVQARHAARLYGRHKDACDTAADGRGQSDTCSPCVVFSRAVVCHSATPWTAACQASLSFTISRSLLKHVHWVSDAIHTSLPLSSPSPPAFNLSQHQGLLYIYNYLF